MFGQHNIRFFSKKKNNISFVDRKIARIKIEIKFTRLN